MNPKIEFANLTKNEWLKKAAVVALYHMQSGGAVRDTALYFNISIGYVSESVLLIDNFEKIKDCSMRFKALQRIKGLK